MKPDDFETAVRSLEGWTGIVGLFGGNCCLSPYFEDYCRILRAYVPLQRRGLWSNHPRGKGALCRSTFWPNHSNLNVHMSQEAYDEFSRDWPESRPFLKGLEKDSTHGAPFVAIKDVIADESTRWEMIAQCDVNKFWSSAIGLVPSRGLRAYFCELAYAQAALHCDNPEFKDVGMAVEPGWFRRPMKDFQSQAEQHCHSCGIPLRRPPQPAIHGTHEEFSETHRSIARPKVRDRPVEFVTIGGMIKRGERPSTQYLPNVTPGYRGE